jgi:hypothetical protein
VPEVIEDVRAFDEERALLVEEGLEGRTTRNVNVVLPTVRVTDTTRRLGSTDR